MPWLRDLMGGITGAAGAAVVAPAPWWQRGVPRGGVFGEDYDQKWAAGLIPGSPGYEAAVQQNPNIDPQTGRPWEATDQGGWGRTPAGRETGPPPGMSQEAWQQGEDYLNRINPGRMGTGGLTYNPSLPMGYGQPQGWGQPWRTASGALGAGQTSPSGRFLQPGMTGVGLGAGAVGGLFGGLFGGGGRTTPLLALLAQQSIRR